MQTNFFFFHRYYLALQKYWFFLQGWRLEHNDKVKDMSEEQSGQYQISGVKIEMYKILLTQSVRCAKREILSQPNR